MRKSMTALVCAALSCIGSANATDIGPWSCTDDGLPVCSYAQGDNLFQLIPLAKGDAIDIGIAIVGQCHKDAVLSFSNGLTLKPDGANDLGPAKCYYEFSVKHQSMDVMSNALLKSTTITLHAGTKTFTAPITENDDLVHVLQYWKRQQGL